VFAHGADDPIHHVAHAEAEPSAASAVGSDQFATPVMEKLLHLSAVLKAEVTRIGE